MGKTQLKSGILGFGFIGKTHAQAAQAIPFAITKPQLTVQTAALLRTHRGEDNALLTNLGNPKVFTDLDAFLASDIDYADICSPNHAHLPQVLAAAKANKAIYCEKPLARNLAEAKQMLASVNEAGVKTHTAFTLRYLPGVVQAKTILSSGMLGAPLHYRAIMYHSSYLNTERPSSWRLRKEDSGGGAWMDLGSHMLNLMQYLLGEPCAITAWQRTFIGDRPATAGASERLAVDVDDWCLAQLEHDNGSSGTVEVTRVAAGTGEDTSFEIYCSGGALRFNASKPEVLHWIDTKSNAWSLMAPGLEARVNGHPISELWPSAKYSLGMMVNGHLASIYDFALCLSEGKDSELNIAAAVRTQRLLEAANISAAEGNRKIDLNSF